ncbi:hypothetical protein ACLESO_16685 [Pyxidicoccus sp. 3LG]
MREGEEEIARAVETLGLAGHVLGKRLDWLLIENDHNEALVIGPCGARAGD